MRVSFLAAALLGVAPHLAAQGPPALGPGARVRVQSTGESGFLDQRTEGTIERISGDTLVLAQKVGGSRRIFVGHPETRLFVFTGRRASGLRGAMIGGGIGLVAGGTLGLVAGEVCVNERSLCLHRKQVALIGSAIVGVIGFGTGLLIGSVSHHEVWMLIPPPSAAMGVGFAIPL